MPKKVKIPTMPKTLRLRISPQAKQNGVAGSPSRCMYALAIREAFPAASFVRVGNASISITAYGQYWHYKIGLLNQNAIIKHDVDKDQVTPAEHLLTVKLLDVEPAKTAARLAKDRAGHRARTAKMRAQPGYVRPKTPKGGTLRVRLAKAITGSFLIRKDAPRDVAGEA